ncbi:hypothetical protein J4711_14050 [Staphylococcus epidermidis]|nr:hypothetical protein [Staphylococcus epidermidis]
MALTQFCASKSGGSLSGFYGEGARSLSIGDRATISTWRSNMGPHSRHVCH